MKNIAVTINTPEHTSPLSEVFGRCGYFLIYNQGNTSEKILPNPYANVLGGAGIQTAQLLIENKIDVVITKQIGVNPLRFLESANIKVYLCKTGTASDAIRLLNEGKLYTLENITESGRRRRRCGKRF